MQINVVCIVHTRLATCRASLSENGMGRRDGRMILDLPLLGVTSR